MKHRTTISLDQELHEKAQRIARYRGTTVSALLSDFLKQEVDPAGSRVESLVGSARLRRIGGEQDPRREYLLNKYIGNEGAD